jgi:hypothetical protein
LLLETANNNTIKGRWEEERGIIHKKGLNAKNLLTIKTGII